MIDQELDGLVRELRDEAIKDGDPETCLGWAAADAIEELRRQLAAADRQLAAANTATMEALGVALDLGDVLENSECVVEEHHDLAAALDAARADAAAGWKWADQFVNYDHLLHDTAAGYRADLDRHHALIGGDARWIR